MRGVRLNPEKITHPFQLMAAWFAMLLILVGTLLVAAARIETPKWIPGFLVISAVALSILVMLAVFTMLTRFRPHLQGPREYAEWLKDERRFTGQTVRMIEVPKIQEIPSESSLTRAESVVRSKVEISKLRRAGEVLKALRQLGFPVSIYHSVLDEGERGLFQDAAKHAAIWIGARVTPQDAVLAIKTVVKIWPHLCYMHLSTDGGSPPDEIHDQMYFGGATSTAEGYKLRRWTTAEIEAIPDAITIEHFHELVRTKYGS